MCKRNKRVLTIKLRGLEIRHTIILFSRIYTLLERQQMKKMNWLVTFRIIPLLLLQRNLWLVTSKRLLPEWRGSSIWLRTSRTKIALIHLIKINTKPNSRSIQEIRNRRHPIISHLSAMLMERSNWTVILINLEIFNESRRITYLTANSQLIWINAKN